RLPAHAALRGEPVQGASAGRLRAALIVVQFTISIGLIVGAFTVEKQLDYALSKPLGFDPRGVVLVDIPRENAGASLEVLRNRLQALDGVAALSWGSSAPSRSISDGFALLPEGGAE